jgi:hypothetical protein
MVTPPPASTIAPAAVPPWTHRDRLTLAVLALASAAGYAALGAFGHPFPVPGPEWDGYVQRARDLAAGGLGYSAYHPYGLPLLLAGLQQLGLDAFAAGRLVAACGGAALVAAAYGIARCWTGRAAALAAALALGATGLAGEHATMACSDMPAAGALALAFACWVAAARRDGRQLRLLFLGAVGIGVAAGFRFPSMFVALGALALLAGGPWRRRLARALALGAGGAVGLSPQLWASFRASGTLLGNENWRNLVFKYQHGFDLRQAVLERDKAADHLAAHWQEWLATGLGDAGELLGRGLAVPFAPSWPAPLLVAASGALTVVLLLGIFALGRAARVLALGALAAGLGSALTFLASGRFLLPLLLPLVVLTLVAVQRFLPWRHAALAAALAALVWQAVEAPAALARYAQRHRQPELAAIRDLAREHDGLCNVQSPVMLDPFAVAAYITVQPPLPANVAPASAAVWQHVARTAAKMATDFVVIARTTAPALVDALGAGTPPPGYEIVRQDDVLIVRCPPRANDWLAGAAVERDGDVVRLQLEVTVADADVLVPYLFLRDASRHWFPLDLRRDPAHPGRYAREFGVAALPAGELVFVPAILHRDSALLHGAPIVRRFQ